MKVPELKGGQMMTIAYIVGIILVIFIVIKALQKIGLVASKEKRAREAEKVEALDNIRTDDYWNPNYYKGKSFKSLGSNLAETYAKELRRSLRGIGTDEEQINVTFGKMFNVINISEVAEKYYLMYKNSLQADLLNDLSDKEIVTLMNVINDLPLK
jgi:hypothetical protein